MKKTHYSKKFDLGKTLQLSREKSANLQHFHEFFTKIFFLTIFLVKSKMSTAKKSKTTTFSRVFHPKNQQFSREIEVEFVDKK